MKKPRSANTVVAWPWMDPAKLFSLVVAFATGVNVGVQLWGGGGGDWVSFPTGSTSGASGTACPTPPLSTQSSDTPSQLSTQEPITEPQQQQTPPVGHDTCQSEYDRVTADQVVGITQDDLDRSRAWTGHRGRLAEVMRDLPTMAQTWIVSGGSISLGHGVESQHRYSSRLEDWMNRYYSPIHNTDSESKQHRVLNRGTHGADICAMAKRLNMFVADVKHHNPRLFILEFAVNDYQGQDHEIQLDFKMDVFFDGYQEKALCAEMVVEGLLRQFPKAAILFLEFQTAVLQRKTAALLHMGVAQQYQIPVISYAEALMPDYERLMRLLEPYSYSTKTVPPPADMTPQLLQTYGPDAANFTADPVLPFPHGCSPCRRDLITPGFRPNGCAHLCTMVHAFVNHSIVCDPVPQSGREPCFLSMWAHDEVHPSGVGHAMAKDLIVHALASVQRDTCRGRTYPPSMLPQYGFLAASPEQLRQRSEFILVHDTYPFFVRHHPLRASSHSAGFAIVEDRFGRPGWIADRPQGGDTAVFNIDVPHHKCYAVYLAVLKSYRGMGTFTVSVQDLASGQTTNIEVDGLWKPRISIPQDIQLTQDTVAGCTGKCQVTVTTHPKVEGRDGNKVKIMTLSVRKCVEGLV